MLYGLYIKVIKSTMARLLKISLFLCNIFANNPMYAINPALTTDGENPVISISTNSKTPLITFILAFEAFNLSKSRVIPIIKIPHMCAGYSQNMI